MKKIAVFVEGLTEQLFIIKLIRAIAGRKDIAFEVKRQNKGLLNFVELQGNSNPIDYFILIVNCCADNQVKSQISMQYDSLKIAGYSKIIGLRDVFPANHADIPKIQRFTKIGLPATNDIEILLAVLEIEAWFIEEHTHFARIHPDMNLQNIANIGVDLANANGEALLNPAQVLHQIYSNWNLAYKKRGPQIERSVNALCETELYLNVSQRCASLGNLINSIETAMF